MAYDGSGTFNRLYSWAADKANSIKILASRMDDEMDGFATGLSNAITKDGQTTVTADIPLNSHKLTGMADAASDADALNRRTGDSRYGILADLSGALSAGGSANALTLTVSNKSTALADGLVLHFVASSANTGAATLAVTNGSGTALGSKALRKVTQAGEAALAAGDIIAAMHCIVEYDASANSGAGAWVLLNPALGTAASLAASAIPLLASANTFTTGQNIAGAGGTVQMSVGTVPSIYFRDASGNYIGWIGAPSAGGLRLAATNAAGSTQQSFAVNADGSFGFSGINSSLPVASGGTGSTNANGAAANILAGFPSVGQLQFPSSQIAASDANTLDDYEEGTFTPALTFGTTQPTGLTYSQQSGTYVKVGRIVFYAVVISLSAVGTGGVGAISINLPFSASGTVAYGSAACSSVSMPGTTTQFTVEPNGATALLQSVGNNVGISSITYSTLSSSSQIRVAGFFFT